MKLELTIGRSCKIELNRLPRFSMGSRGEGEVN